MTERRWIAYKAADEKPDSPGETWGRDCHVLYAVDVIAELGNGVRMTRNLADAILTRAQDPDRADDWVALIYYTDREGGFLAYYDKGLTILEAKASVEHTLSLRPISSMIQDIRDSNNGR